MTRTAGDVFVLDLRQAAEAGPALAGGKGANLGRLLAAGFPVPPGLVVAVDAYREFIRHNGLAGTVEESAHTPIDELSLAGLRQRIEDSPIPPPVAAEIAAGLERLGLADRPLAVRSSATAEDSPDASFAGIHRTSLNVRGTEAVLAAVRACYASLWTPQAVAYRRRKGLRHAAMAVVVQELLPSEAAGVTFTADPVTGGRQTILINASWGLGEAVVSGAVEPDQYLVAHREGTPILEEVRVGAKAALVRPVGLQGVEVVPVAEDRRNAAVLDTERIMALAGLAARVEETLGAPQDVEWALAGGRFHLLQARPITTGAVGDAAPAAAEPWRPGVSPNIWSNANLKEVIPGVVSPLTLSISFSILERNYAAFYRAIGFPLPPGVPLLRLAHGRFYFNLSLMQWLAYESSGGLPAEVNRALGGDQPEIAVPPGNPMAGWRGMVRWYRRLRTLAIFRSTRRQAPRAFARAESSLRRVAALDLSAVPDAAILDALVSLRGEIARFHRFFVTATIATAVSIDALKTFLERMFPGRGASLANRLLTGIGGVESADHGYALRELARLAAADERVRSFFLPADQASPRYAGIEAELAGTPFLAAWHDFLARYGHRGFEEWEIMNPRWREDPTFPLETVRSYLLHPPAATAPERGTAGRDAEAEVEAALRRSAALLTPGRLFPYRVVLGQARDLSRLRENAKSLLVKLIGEVRRLCLEAGARLAERGVLAGRDDVFFLEIRALERLLPGTGTGEDWRSVVAERRQEYRRLASIDPPSFFYGDGEPLAGDPGSGQAWRAPTDGAVPAGEATFIGLGISAGRTEGYVRVVRNPAEGVNIQPGDILVAPATDPAWTPLFLRAAGILLETGGLLSHTAIVAREYGIPAVSNIPGLLDRVRDGDRVVVDGDTGTVRVDRR